MSPVPAFVSNAKSDTIFELSRILVALNLTREDSIVRLLPSDYVAHAVSKRSSDIELTPHLTRTGVIWLALVSQLEQRLKAPMRAFGAGVADAPLIATAVPQFHQHAAQYLARLGAPAHALLGPMAASAVSHPHPCQIVAQKIIPMMAQGLGWGGTALGLLMTNMHDKATMMLTGVCCSVCQIGHFWLLGETLAAWEQGVLLLMCALAYYEQRRWARLAYWLLYPLVLFDAPRLEGIEWLPMLGSLLSIIARHQSNLLYLRGIMIFANVPWLPYCWATNDTSNLVGFVVFTALSVIAFVRFHIVNSKNRDT